MLDWEGIDEGYLTPGEPRPSMAHPWIWPFRGSGRTLCSGDLVFPASTSWDDRSLPRNNFPVPVSLYGYTVLLRNSPQKRPASTIGKRTESSSIPLKTIPDGPELDRNTTSTKTTNQKQTATLSTTPHLAGIGPTSRPKTTTTAAVVSVSQEASSSSGGGGGGGQS
jgi:hypothetical protein